MERSVLAIFPHPDDETFGCGGTIALFTKSNVPVTYICATLGQMGRNMGKPFFATRESLPLVREGELTKACQILGIGQVIKLGLRDKMIEFEDPEQLTAKIERILREIRPSLVLTHYPGFAVHPDHNALGAATIRAISHIPAAERPKVYASAFSHHCQDVLGPPDVIMDISEVVQVKMAAIRAHQSQSQGMLARLDEAKVIKASEQKALNRFLREEAFWTYHFSE